MTPTTQRVVPQVGLFNTALLKRGQDDEASRKI